MADERGIIRYVRAIFDRASGKKMEQEFEASLSAAGKKSGKGFLDELRAAFNKRMGQLREQLAKGVIDQKEFRRQSDIAARAFNQGLLANIEKARKAGNLTDREYIKLTRTLKRVGDEGGRSVGRVNSSMDRLRDIALKVTAAMASLWVVRRVAEFGKAIFDLGSQVLAVGNQFNTVFGEPLGEMLRERTEELRLMAGLTRRESEEILAGAGSMAQGFGMAKDASADFAQQILQLSADLASFNNVPTADAARLIQSALIGNTEAARSLKVSFTALDVQNRALAMTGKGTAKELTQEEKALAALVVMTERAGPQIGDLNRTQNDSDNVAKQLAGSYRQVKESLAAVLVEGTAGQLGLSLLRDLFRDLDRWVTANADSIQMWATGVVKSVANVARGFRELWDAVFGIVALFKGALFGVLAAGARGLQLVAEAAALASDAKARFLGLFSKEHEQRARDAAAATREYARSLREWAEAAEGTASASLHRGLFGPQRTSPTDVVGPPAPDGTTPTTPTTPTGAGGSAADRAKALDREHAAAIAAAKAATDAVARREELLATMAREADVLARRTAATLQGEAAVDALNRQLYIEDQLLRSGAAAGSAFAAEVTALAGAQYDAAQGFEAATAAAAEFQDSTTNALRDISEEMERTAGMAGTIAEAIASGGIAGLAQLAKAKVIENIAWAVENFAKALGALNPAASAKFLAAGKGHLLAAAKWGVAAAGASALSGGGGGGRAAGGTSAPDSRAADRAQPAGPELHIYFEGEGFDAVNPYVQDVVRGAIENATERTGPNAKPRVYTYRNGRRH